VQQTSGDQGGRQPQRPPGGAGHGVRPPAHRRVTSPPTMVELTAAHWVYLVGIVAILATMLARKNIIVPAVFFTMLVGIVYTGSLPAGLAAIFNATLVAAQELFNIFLIIALVTGMLGALQALGSDKRMVAPFRP